MPELPEVQTVINYLNENINSLKILNVNVIREKFLKNIDSFNFANNVINQKIMKVIRHGKHIVFKLTNDHYFVSHLRMEGRWYVVEPQVFTPFNHTHLIFDLDNKKQLRYIDTRQFGTIHYYNSYQEMISSLESKTGLDALDKKCDGEYLYECFHKTNIPIKAALLDQSKIMGIGNIYANEVCFAMNINPTTPFKDIKKSRYEELSKVIKNILLSAIAQNGTTVHSFEFGMDKTGEFQNELAIYNRNNKPCFVCNTIIEKVEIKQRGTYFCKTCQK